MKRSFLTIAAALSLNVSIASAAPVEPCRVAKSCSQANQICQSGSGKRCFGWFEGCKQTGMWGSPPRACTVASRN
jgi:hypothetical protein